MFKQDCVLASLKLGGILYTVILIGQKILRANHVNPNSNNKNEDRHREDCALRMISLHNSMEKLSQIFQTIRAVFFGKKIFPPK